MNLGAPLGPVMNIFTCVVIIRVPSRGGQNSQNPIKGRPILHITGAAYSDSIESIRPAPALVADEFPPAMETGDATDATVINESRHISTAPSRLKYWKGGIAVGVLVMGAAAKVKEELGQFSLKTLLTESSKNVVRFITDNVLMVAMSCENGFFEGFTSSLWPEGPAWFSWVVRVFCYLFVCYQCGFWPFVVNHVSLLARKLANKVSIKSVSPVVKKKLDPIISDVPPVVSVPKSRKSYVSSAASDLDDSQCLAHLVCMSLDTGTMPLSHRDCTEVFASTTRLLKDDLSASHLPPTYEVSGKKLRHTHGDVYAKLRGTLMCAEPNCTNAGQSNSTGLFFCHLHLVNSIIPPQVQSQGEI